MKGWLFLLAAVACEIAGTTCLKLSAGFTRAGPAMGMVMFYLGTLVNASIAMQYLEIGLVYAVWSGLGTATITAIGIVFFHESVALAKFICLGLIIAGVVGLYLTNGRGAVAAVPAVNVPASGR